MPADQTTTEAAAAVGPAAVPAGRDAGPTTPLHTRILIGLAVGVACGLATNALFGGADERLAWVIANITEPAGHLFLRLLLMLVIPLVFSSLIIGVVGLGSLRKLGRVGLKTLLYTLAFSAISVVIGLSLANAIRPGERMDASVRDDIRARYGTDAGRRVAESKKTESSDSPLMSFVKTVVPINPIAAVAADTPNMLHLMFFALIFGIGLMSLPQDRAAPLVGALEAIYGVSAKIIDLVMRLAPFAVACLLFNNTARFGTDLLVALAAFVLTVLLGLGLHMFGVYSLSIYFLARINPLEFYRRIKTAMLTAFSTSSSNATLPTALRVGEENLGIPREINSFVLTVGATANQNGTALYEGVTVLFLAQLAGVDLLLSQQLLVAGLAILGGIGTAGVPSGSIPFVILVLAQIGVPPEWIAIVLGVDRILDMCRTTLNVSGDLAAAAYVARSEGHVLLQKPAVL